MSEIWYVWLGGLTVAQGAGLLGTGYAIWRYVYEPWKVMRRDIAALGAQHAALKAEIEASMASRRMDVLTDEEVALREQALKFRQVERAKMGRHG